EAFARLAASAPGLTAGVWGNDILAIGVMMEAATRGIDVPGALSVTRFDDIDLERACSPALTPVRPRDPAIGRRAAGRMLARLEGNAPARIEDVRVELIERGSTGRPRARAPRR